ncbi:hypothetical protein [Bacillus sp. AFS029533]|uniref:hypothetical protein n=1 Tax=Bacillus sp. AFS029533 TaxID=2033494 RepID=UPI000BFCE38B|nr:hypothetical protein [Bacillus sp. AFS029533]PGZ88987.1 hypothetical protein COE53_19180 [Bacillus sp. AFS029533]
MIKYRGIKLLNEVRLYRADGEYNSKVTGSLDRLIKVTDELGYKVIGAWKNASTPVKMRCNNGHVSNVIPNNLTSNRQGGCWECYQKGIGINNERAFKNILKRKGWKIQMDEEYINYTTEIPLVSPSGRIYYYKPKTVVEYIVLPE